MLTIPPVSKIETQRLRLRVCQGDDAVEVWGAERDTLAELRHWFWWAHPGHGEQQSAAWSNSRVSAWNKGEEFSFLIRTMEGARVLGCVWLNAIDKISFRASLGYWLRAGCEGKGYATEAGREVLHWGFKQGLRRIEIVMAVANIRSRALAERLGAKREGMARSRLCVEGISQDAFVYSVLPEDLK